MDKEGGWSGCARTKTSLKSHVNKWVTVLSGVPKAIGGRCCLPAITLCEGNWVIFKREGKGTKEQAEGGEARREDRLKGIKYRVLGDLKAFNVVYLREVLKIVY